MDAVKFFKEAKRMCRVINCEECPFGGEECGFISADNIEEVIKEVEKWAEEHPVKTRQSEFLKMFPNVPKPFGHVDICPEDLGENKKVTCNGECSRCKREYWLAEVE